MKLPKVTRKSGWHGAGKALLLCRSTAHEEFSDELERLAGTLQASQGASLLDALRLLSASGDETHSMSAKFQRRATSMMGPARDKEFRGIPGSQMHWLAAEYATFTEELLWLIRRSIQCYREGALANWKTLPRPKYRCGFGLSDIFIVESSRLTAEHEQGIDDELQTLRSTLRGLIRTHREIQSHYASLAVQNKRGRPRRSDAMHTQPSEYAGRKALTGRELAIRLLALRDTLTDRDGQSVRERNAAARLLLAEEQVAAGGHQRGSRFREASFDEAVRAEDRRMEQALSRWRLKVQRAARPPQPKESPGLDLQRHWG